MLAAVVALVCALGWRVIATGTPDLTRADIDQAVEQALAAAADPTTATTVFETIAPSLVVVRVEGGGTGAVTIGAGVIINSSGQIMTANHVVADATSIEVIFADGSESWATVSSSEPDMDIAVLEAGRSPSVIVQAVLGNPRTLRIGDDVFVVGNPLGLAASLSSGVVSGLARNIPLADGTTTLERLIQFDAAVNLGNSGGPLLNSSGQVVGIVTALADPSAQGFFVGIGFAVPIDLAAGAAANGPSQ